MGAGGLDKEDPQCCGGEERGWLQVGECGGGMCGGRQEKNNGGPLREEVAEGDAERDDEYEARKKED